MTARLAPGILMDRLERLGVRFELRDGAVLVNAPAGVLTTEDRAQLVRHKATIERLVRLTYALSDRPTQAPLLTMEDAA